MLMLRFQCIDFQMTFKMCLISSHSTVVNDKYSSEQNWVRQKTSKWTNGTKFVGTEKCMYIKYHMPSHA